MTREADSLGGKEEEEGTKGDRDKGRVGTTGALREVKRKRDKGEQKEGNEGTKGGGKEARAR